MVSGVSEGEILEDENDHRILHIHLTEKSNEVINKMNQVYSDCKDIMQRGIDSDELAVVKRVIAKMNDNINRELGE